MWGGRAVPTTPSSHGGSRRSQRRSIYHVDTLARRAPAAAFPLPPVSRKRRGGRQRRRTVMANAATFLPPIQPANPRTTACMLAVAWSSTRRWLIGEGVEQVRSGNRCRHEKAGARGRLCHRTPRGARIPPEGRTLPERGTRPHPIWKIADRRRGRAGSSRVAEAAWQRDWDIDPVLLFRYFRADLSTAIVSTTTRRYAREEERGYPDLVTPRTVLRRRSCAGWRRSQAGQTDPVIPLQRKCDRSFWAGPYGCGRPGGEPVGDIVNRADTGPGKPALQGHFEFG